MEGLQENGQHAVVSDQVPESTFFPSFFFSGRKRIALSLVFLSNIFFIMPHIRYALICTSGSRLPERARAEEEGQLHVCSEALTDVLMLALGSAGSCCPLDCGMPP